MTTLLVGHGGAGKSMLAQVAMTCIPTGNDFLGRTTEGGTTAGMFAEDPDVVLHARQVRINSYLNVDMEALVGRSFPKSYAGVDACLWRAGKTTPVFDRLETDLRHIADLRLIVIDNVALVYADNENDRIPVSGFVNALNGMASRLNAGLILCTHTSKSTEDSGNRLASGSTAWVNASRSVLVVKPDETNPDRVTLRVAKANHARTGDKLELIWMDGVLRLKDAAPTGAFGAIHKRQVDRMFLDALARATAAGITLNASANTSRYAPRYLAQGEDMTGLTERDLTAAMRRLLDARAIREVTEGPPSKPRSRLVMVKQESEE
ncbi:hypothetical protein J2848_000365 [Azospirillum lipoferum]|nr:hypothetical protein [Azospirillum lipoferum]